jgi:diacylglycerol O-acyltransferase
MLGESEPPEVAIPAGRLSPLDASFLTVETPTAHMHVGWATAFEPPEDGPAPSFEDLIDHIGHRLPRAPRFRQRVRTVPLGLSAPVWVDDPHFDLARHVVRRESGTLNDVVDECMSEPLPRDRPLWQVWIADRLDDGRIGLVGKAHHCMVDGIAAVEFASLLVDPEPYPPEPAPDDWSPAPAPDRVALLASGLMDAIRGPLDLATLPARIAGSPSRALDVAVRAQRAARALVDSVRPARTDTPLNPPISPRRHLSLLGRPVEDLLRIKKAFEVKLNDVVLAVCAGGVRRYLKRRGDEAMRFKTMVPVDVREGDGTGDLGNRISFMFVDLPCDEPNPVRRVQEIYQATSERKRGREPEGSDAILRSLSLAPAAVQRLVSRLVASPRTFNLVVSNIPGPREPLYMQGCRLAEAYPVVPIADRHALAIGFTTVCDGAFFGLYADRESLPDVDELAGDIDASIDELLELGRRGGARLGTLVAAAPLG